MSKTLENKWILVSIFGESRKVIYYEDVKQAVLEFKKVLDDAEEDGCINITNNDTRDVLLDIFGDFEK